MYVKNPHEGNLHDTAFTSGQGEPLSVSRNTNIM